MSQHDLDIANQGFPNFRADLNNALQALGSVSAGATEPSTIYAYQLWLDTSTTPSTLKQRNGDNDAWVSLFYIDQSTDLMSLPDIAGNLTLSNGNLTLTSGDITVSSGDLTVSSGDIINSDGSILVGNASSISVGSTSKEIQSHGIGSEGGISVTRFSANVSGASVVIGKSRSASIGSYSAINSGDGIGYIIFAGDDGTDLNTQSAFILCSTEGTIATNQIPGKLELWTANSGGTVTQGLVLDSSQNVDIPNGDLTVLDRFETKEITISDNSYAIVTPPRKGGWCIFTFGGDSTTPGNTSSALFFYDVGTSLAGNIQTDVSTNVTIATANRTGTSGPDGSMNIGIRSNVIHFENRVGLTKNIQITFV